MVHVVTTARKVRTALVAGAVCVAIAFMIPLVGCSSSSRTPVDLWTFANISAITDSVAGFDESSVTRLVVTRATETGVQEYPTTDPETIKAFLSALKQVRVGDAATVRITDDDTTYSFESSDGSVVTFSFEGTCFLRNKNSYVTQDSGRLFSLTSSFTENYVGEVPNA